jgi:hypothetical protein
LPAIHIKAFSGLKPILSPLLLQQGDAQTAVNARLVSGALSPLAGTTTLKTATEGSQTIFRYGNPSSEDANWLQFSGDVDLIRSPIADDQYGRVYWTDGGTPKYATSTILPGGDFTLGVPAPETVPSVSASSYGQVTVEIQSADILEMSPGDKLRVVVDSGNEQIVVLTGTTVTADTLRADLDSVGGLDATVDGGAVVLKTESFVSTSSLKVERQTGEKKDFSADVVSYSAVAGPVAGTTSNGTDPATSATYTFSAAEISAIEPGARFAVKVNANADVVVIINAGVNTFPTAVTATSLRLALASVAGLSAVVNDGTTQTVTVSTVSSGDSSSLLIRKINPQVTPVYTELVSGSNIQNAALVETRTYVYTYVSRYGEEGPPSSASELVKVGSGQAVEIVGMSAAPSGDYDITLKRIYRSSATGTSAQFQFVVEIPVSQANYTDKIEQAALGEVLLTEGWNIPPQGLKGLKLLSNGAAIGFKDNTAYLSEPNLPHAWPHQYPIDETIVGIGVMRQSAVLLTNSHPYVMSGADPQAMSLEQLELPQACVSKRSIVDTGDGVLYASPDGLVSISAGGIDIITKGLLSREQWQAYNPSSMVAAVHDNRYHVAYTTTSGTRGMLVFDFSGQGAVMTTSDINSSSAITAMYAEPKTDTLYMLQGGNIVRFNAGTALTYTWRSKIFRAPFAMNFGRAQVVASGYPIIMKVYADGVLRLTKNVVNGNMFHLPAGFRALDWEIELLGNTSVTQVSVATSAEEMRTS